MVWQAGGRECLSQGPGARSEFSENSHAWESSPDPVLAALPLGGLAGKAQDKGSQPGARWAPKPKLTGEASLGPVDSKAWAPQGTAGWRKGVPVPRPDRGQGPSRSSLNIAMHGSPPQTLFRVPCHLVGRRAKPRTGAPNTMPAGAPEPKLTGESSLGPVDSQVWVPQGTAGWKKRVPAPGPGGGPTRAPKAKLAGEASPGLVDFQT
ncbi:hypothetical protein NDU88_010716 [Pleurodeles waltl]|uniref:Uncharacterized protein n=1 Tax=Pleurodeles waltl TaxID=8319 RepID=A0AAV7PVP6_PLEWA|nr:hypothetical protein NDU88_010716 [Pleurodeles waltl]